MNFTRGLNGVALMTARIAVPLLVLVTGPGTSAADPSVTRVPTPALFPNTRYSSPGMMAGHLRLSSALSFELASV